MKLSLFDQSQHLAEILTIFKSKPLSFTETSALPERYTSNLIPTVQPITDLQTCNLDFLFAYMIFPASMMQSLTEWQLMKRNMQVGDVIVQQVYLPPVSVSLKCIFAVRILNIIETPNHMGFQYGTLAGHAETGVSEFTFVLRENKLYAHIHTFSKPGHILSRVVAPFFTLPYQQYCTNRAVAKMTAHFIQSNPTCCIDR